MGLTRAGVLQCNPAVTRPDPSGAALDHLLRAARLDLPEERRAVVGPTLQAMYAVIDGLDALDLAEVPPATAFDARWE